MKSWIITWLIALCFLMVGCVEGQSQPQEQDMFKDISAINFSEPINDLSLPLTKTSKDISTTFGKQIVNSVPKIEVENTFDEYGYTEEYVEPYTEEYYDDGWYDYSYDSGYTYNNWSGAVPDSGLTPESGVNYYDGRTETYYSSNVLYHYQTDQWTADDEGFYRTDEGYYVVAASDMPQGTTFEGSKGTCVVCDTGCAAGTTDYYVNW